MLPQIPEDSIILTEYGRNIQNMVRLAMEIEDKEERTRCVNSIIDTMGIFFPHLRDVNDFKHKLWDHLAIMSNYKLDIDYPYEVPQEAVKTTPEKLAYPESKIRMRYYGNFINKLVLAADKFEGEERDRYITLLGNHMKRSYLTWNKNSVDDQTILNDMYELSGGKIDVRNGGCKLRGTDEILQQLSAGHNQANKKNGKKPQQKKKN